MVDRLVLGSALILVGCVCLFAGAFRAAFNHRAEFLLWTGSAMLLVVGGCVVLQ